LELSKWANL